jgi:protein-S-isoprenylcysteine O-methyltransferase Ste14
MSAAFRSAASLLVGILIFAGAVLALVLLWRIYDEEALMHGEFGPDWEAYCMRSWRLLSFVY